MPVKVMLYTTSCTLNISKVYPLKSVFSKVVNVDRLYILDKGMTIARRESAMQALLVHMLMFRWLAGLAFISQAVISRTNFGAHKIEKSG